MVLLTVAAQLVAAEAGPLVQLTERESLFSRYPHQKRPLKAAAAMAESQVRVMPHSCYREVCCSRCRPDSSRNPVYSAAYLLFHHLYLWARHVALDQGLLADVVMAVQLRHLVRVAYRASSAYLHLAPWLTQQ